MAKKCCNFFITYRYLIALFAFILSVGLNLHGSSISNWNNYGVSQTYYDKTIETKNDFNTKKNKIDIEKNLKNWISIPPREDGVIAGVPRMIRTDEWLVQTPFYLSQVNQGNPLINPSYATSGQNMLLAYNAPIKHISVIGKPFNWGFLFLGASKGLAWYWSFKLIGFLLLAYEFSMILTKRNKPLSVLGSLWLTFTPAIQWWFMQHLGDVVFFTLLLMVCIYHFFGTKNLVKKLLFASCISSGIIGFTLVLYPAFQVPFAYLILLFFLIQLIKAWGGSSLEKVDWIFMGLSVVFAGAILLHTLLESMDAIKATLNTVYPGSRVSSGGEMKLINALDMLTNILLPYKIPSFNNQVELSHGFYFLPFFVLSLPFILKKKDILENSFGISLSLYSLFLVFYSIVGIPESISKVLLFGFVTSSRAWQTLSVVGVMTSLWFVSFITNKGIKEKLGVLLNTVLGFVCFLCLVLYRTSYRDYVSARTMFVILVTIVSVFILFIYNRRKIASILLLSLIVLSGLTINPLVKGISVINDKSLSVAIQSLKSKNADAIWMSENSYLYQFTQMFGVRAIDGVRFYPDFSLMESIDTDKKYKTQWNRYAHIRYLLTEEPTYMSNPSPDVLHIELNISQLTKLKVKYILTNRNLTDLFGRNFKKIYGSDGDGNMIFQFTENVEQ